MRLLELRLLAFGPFTDERLDLSAPGPALHVVYGNNEAGKSSALRAITGLMFGIPQRTPDGHLHRLPKLRIGARLAASDGTQLEVVRRKGVKATLLDPAGEPLDEAILQRMLGGVSRGLFLTMFGLDHVSLREGAKALLAGKGDVGESLFDAAGAGGVHEVLERFRHEADALYKPRGKALKLNEALRELKEAKKKTVLAAMGGDAWQTQKTALQNAEQELETLLEKRQLRGAEHNRMQRVLRVLPQLAKREELRERRAQYAELQPLVLTDEARQARVETQRLLEICALEAESQRVELTRLKERRDALAPEGSFPQGSLAAVDEATIEEVRNRLGNHRSAALQLPQRRGQHQAFIEEARSMLRDLGRGDDLEGVEALRIDKATEARIEQLAKAHGRLAERNEAALLAQQQHQSKLDATGSMLDALDPPRDIEALRAAVTRATRAGDLDAMCARAQQTAERAERDLQLCLSGLDGFEGTAQAACDLKVPGEIAVEAAQLRYQTLEQQADKVLVAQQQLDARKEALVAALDELALSGALPSEELLREARQRRDQLFDRLASEWTDDTSRAYLSAREHADGVADRLRREAGRVAQQARLRAEERALERNAAAIDRELQALDKQRRDWRDSWETLWKPSTIIVGGPREMVSWLQRHQQLTVANGRTEEAQAELSRLLAQRSHLQTAIEQQLTGVTRELSSGGLLGELIDSAAPLITSNEELERRRASLIESQRTLESEAQLLLLGLAQSQEALQVWRDSWKECMSRIGLAAQASVEEAMAVLTTLRALQAKLREAEQMQRRIRGIERDATAFSADVRALCELHAVELADSPTVEHAADQLSRRYRQARSDAEQAAALDREIDTRQQALSSIETRRQQAQARLGELLREARVSDVEALEKAELRSEEVRSIDARLAEIEDALLDAGEGSTIDELVALAHGIDADEVRPRVFALDQELDELNERIAQLNGDIATHRVTLEERFERRPGAFGAAAEVQSCLATVRQHTEEYLRKRLAVLVLEQEIERYRQQNEGPILARARVLFSRLTLGGYSGMVVDYSGGDEPELCCVRTSGERLGVAGLSDGTRDQLYLALRLATLERFAERGEMLPLVLDDILIHFDDERAQAALELLSELSKITQVLFFTHHQRLVDLAKKSLPADSLELHQLAASSAQQEPA